MHTLLDHVVDVEVRGSLAVARAFDSVLAYSAIPSSRDRRSPAATFCAMGMRAESVRLNEAMWRLLGYEMWTTEIVYARRGVARYSAAVTTISPGDVRSRSNSRARASWGTPCAGGLIFRG